MSAEPVRLGVIGDADVVARSLSPRMQQAALDALGIAGTYERLPVAAGGVGALVASLVERGFTGANVTMPHKHEAARCADVQSPVVTQMGAANTLVFSRSGIVAEATDGVGMAAALDARGIDLAGLRVLLVGAGGAAAEAAHAVMLAGAGHLDVWNRGRSRAEELARRLQNVAHGMGLEVLDDLPIQPEADVLISAVPDGAVPEALLAGKPTIPVVVEFAYRSDRSPTMLIEAARKRGAETVDGLELLARQGAESFRHWFGSAPYEVMQRALT